MKETLEIGEIVTGIYKTGKYIGEITNSRPGSYVVKVLAVLKHPVQGDLHNVKQADVPFFHERRALAYREQTNVPQQMVKKYEGDIPDYKESLQAALETQMSAFQEDDSPFAQRSLQTLQQLKQDYKL
ncbi:kinase-associated lipoprotein B [Bacillus gaemokensis]|uniref:Kinase n=1 Tax=Bacillus gaemokensis TaxID=574375 RepID=A0A073KEY5_9BACI|nr:kinase-associated lipoprotein B [Bacillus gaemokensis]KEK25140.1 kinase [Bacillus gaemokensis]KYG37417.1 kinase [Bacillus gaemokensis]